MIDICLENQRQAWLQPKPVSPLSADEELSGVSCKRVEPLLRQDLMLHIPHGRRCYCWMMKLLVCNTVHRYVSPHE